MTLWPLEEMLAQHLKEWRTGKGGIGRAMKEGAELLKGTEAYIPGNVQATYQMYTAATAGTLAALAGARRETGVPEVKILASTSHTRPRRPKQIGLAFAISPLSLNLRGEAIGRSPAAAPRARVPTPLPRT
jgi:hypothetical protein